MPKRIAQESSGTLKSSHDHCRHTSAVHKLQMPISSHVVVEEGLQRIAPSIINQSLHLNSGDILNLMTTLHTVKTVLKTIMEMDTQITSQCLGGSSYISAIILTK
jgi:hypothetical protein